MATAPPPRDEQREQRLARIVAGAHDEYERIAAWFDYLDQHLHFPFRALCTGTAADSPLHPGAQVEVIELADVDGWQDQVWVMLGGGRDGTEAPLVQLEPLDSTDAGTCQAVADWHYWVARGYHFWGEDDGGDEDF